jgi:hypothetical protein
MMSDHVPIDDDPTILILIDGDQAIFFPSFAAATVVVRPGTLQATGPATLKGAKLCVSGDEESVLVAGCMYTTPSHPIPGTGMLKIKSLKDDQIAEKTRSGGKPVLLVGKTFDAEFVVSTKAQQPPPSSASDSSTDYPGTGIFVTTNQKFRGV